MRAFFLFLVSVSMTFVASSAEKSLEPISQSEAEAIVLKQEMAKAARNAEFRAMLESVPAVEEFAYSKGNHQVVHRRIQPRKKQVKAKVEEAPTVALSFSEMPVGPLGEYSKTVRSEMISIHATNYDQLYSEITWRDDAEKFTVFTNIPLTYLQVIGSFEFEDVHYSYFGFVDQIDSDAERERVTNSSLHGHSYKSRWKDAPVSFSREKEYVVVTEHEDVIIPEKLYDQMSAILGYYTQNEETLRVSYENAQRMRKAYSDYREKNPPQPEDSVVIYSLTPSGESQVER